MVTHYFSFTNLSNICISITEQFYIQAIKMRKTSINNIYVIIVHKLLISRYIESNYGKRYIF